MTIKGLGKEKGAAGLFLPTGCPLTMIKRKPCCPASLAQATQKGGKALLQVPRYLTGMGSNPESSFATSRKWMEATSRYHRLADSLPEFLASVGML